MLLTNEAPEACTGWRGMAIFGPVINPGNICAAERQFKRRQDAQDKQADPAAEQQGDEGTVGLLLEVQDREQSRVSQGDDNERDCQEIQR